MWTFILILVLTTDIFQHTYSRQCKFFPKVALRHKSCFKKENCQRDSDCRNEDEKCCEDQCGLLRCQQVLDDQPAPSLEKCPSPANIQRNCQKTRTTFCYKKDCKRCCTHVNVCNPQPSILNTLESCKKAICSTYKCNIQGEQCLVDETTVKPYCRCIQQCPRQIKPVCGRDTAISTYGRLKTFTSRCAMDREACERKRSILFLYEGSCRFTPKKKKPYVKPLITPDVVRSSNGSFLSVLCKTDERGRRPVWFQRRTDGTEIDISPDNGSSLSSSGGDGLFMELIAVGHGSYGEYVCKQKFDGHVFETSFRLLPPENYMLDKSSCRKKPDNGDSRCNLGKFPNFYYDVKEKQCKPFTYNGCGGNENNFQTRKECEIVCGGQLFETDNRNFSKFSIHHGGQCGREQCEFYAKCIKATTTTITKQKDKRKTCTCRKACSLFPRLVCGSDGRTYLSLCILEAVACRYRRSVFVVHSGKCEEPTKQMTPSTAENLPKRRKNTCYYESCPPYARCTYHPLTGVTMCQCAKPCLLRPNKVCATNMREYLNTCFMEVASCKANMKFEVYKKGTCPLV